MGSGFRGWVGGGWVGLLLVLECGSFILSPDHLVFSPGQDVLMLLCFLSGESFNGINLFLDFYDLSLVSLCNLRVVVDQDGHQVLFSLLDSFSPE